MRFDELRLAEPIVRAVVSEGYTTPTPIQEQSIPHALEGLDVLGCAQTGTGKTCAFALPILHRLAGPPDASGRYGKKGRQGRPPRALILAPTRELASQIYDSFVAYGRNLPLRHTVVYGGVNQFRQVRAMQAGVDVLVATPGRLLDLINQGHIDLRSIEVLVLDEADRMLDMGFINDIRKIVDMIPTERQTLFFSATLSREIRKLADSMLQDPVQVQTAPEATAIETIQQSVYLVERQQKAPLLERLLLGKEVGKTLVFTRTKHGADKVVKFLHRIHVNAEAIHGNKSQNARTRAMNGFRSGKIQVLVATDIAARGIDVDDITHVVNFDMPLDAETYVHRIGRTARAGASGTAISFCDAEEVGLLRSVENRSRIKIEVALDHPDLTVKSHKSVPGGRGKKPFVQGNRSSGGGQQSRRRRSNDSNPRQPGGSGRSRKPAAGAPGTGAKRKPRRANSAR